jgi:hypothetical protein
MTTWGKDIVLRLNELSDDLAMRSEWDSAAWAKEAADEIESLRRACRAMAREIERMKHADKIDA